MAAEMGRGLEHIVVNRALAVASHVPLPEERLTHTEGRSLRPPVESRALPSWNDNTESEED